MLRNIICTKCSVLKPETDFYNSKSKPDGKHHQCIPCMKAKMKPKTKDNAIRDANKYALAHPERVKATWRKYYEKNKDKLRISRTAYLKTSSGKSVTKANFERTKDRINARRKIYRQNLNPTQKMAKVVRDRFYKVVIRMREGKKSMKTEHLVGCSFDELKLHIESLFLDGMTWKNHGNGEGKWNVDHIIPLVKFDLLDINEQVKAFNYKNLRPLWFIDNITRPRKHFELQVTQKSLKPV